MLAQRDIRANDSRRSARRSKRARAQARLAWWLVLPTLIVIAIVIIFPTLMSVYQSFFGAKGVDPATGFVNESEPFVGFDNYISMFHGDTGARFQTAFWNTTIFALLTVSIETVLGVAMALIMHKAMRGRGFVRAAILVPWAIPTAVSAILWRWIFDTNGVANAIIGTQVIWAIGDWSAKLTVIIADTWKTAPFIGLLTLAGLQMIPEEVYEAAKIDGAGVWKRFVSITLPLVKPALVVAVLFRMLDAMRMFDLPYILIGARKSSVETLSMLVQDEASNLRYGSAAAYAIVLFLYVFLLAFAFVKVLGADIMGMGERDGHGKMSLSLIRRGYRRGQPAVRPAAGRSGQTELVPSRQSAAAVGGGEHPTFISNGQSAGAAEDAGENSAENVSGRGE
ncbi:MAG: sugar ABC transporter permease [Actinomycetaceae bacterium]|nr:sugar ABC transporter permease [Arcanobacterium sp.]MDD7687715.1 sugar ABC transporter permease [Actinomycetaceae bacterium]MDY5274238.1 sugar ABC transporter permease [Arcanobacterium sp.]